MLSAILTILLLAPPPPPLPPTPKLPAPAPALEDLEDLLVRQLSDKDPKVREHAAEILAKLGPQAGFAAPELWKTCRAARTEKTWVRSRCRTALVAIGPAAVPVLTKSLAKNEPEWDREDAIDLLKSIAIKHGPESIKEVIPALTEIAEELNHVGGAALRALGSAKKTATSALPNLERMFERSEGYRKLQIAECLRLIAGPDHRQVEPYFKQVQKDSDLIDAAATNDLAKVRRLVQEGANVHNPISQMVAYPIGYTGRTALIHAASNGNEEMVKFLLASKADPNYDLKGKTALDFAKTEAVKTLLKKAGATEKRSDGNPKIPNPSLRPISELKAGAENPDTAPSDKPDPAQGTDVQGDLEKAGISEEEYARQLEQSQER
jgi:HEAT repeat protein